MVLKHDLYVKLNEVSSYSIQYDIFHHYFPEIICCFKIAPIWPHMNVQGAVKAWIIANFHEIVINTI